MRQVKIKTLEELKDYKDRMFEYRNLGIIIWDTYKHERIIPKNRIIEIDEDNIWQVYDYSTESIKYVWIDNILIDREL